MKRAQRLQGALLQAPQAEQVGPSFWPAVAMGPPRVSDSSKRPRLMIVPCFPARVAPPPAARSGQHCTWVHLQEEKHLLQVRGTWAEGGVECSGMVPIGMVPSLDSNSTPTAAAGTASVSSSSNTHSTDVAFVPVALASAITTTTFAPTPAPLSLSTTALAPYPACAFPFSLPGFPSSLTDGLPHGHPPSLPSSGDLAESLPELSDEDMTALELALCSPRTQAPMLLEANRVATGTGAEEAPAAQASEQTTQMPLASTSASWYASPPGSGWVNQQLVAEDTSNWLPGVSPVVQYAPQYLPAVSHCGTSSRCLSTAAASVPATSPSNALLLREMFYTHVLGLGLTRRPGNSAKLDTCCSRGPATLSWPLQYGPGGSPKLAPPKTL